MGLASLLALRHEVDMQGLEVLLHIKVVLLCASALSILEGSEEGSQTFDLHSLRLQQHLYQTAAELLLHTKYHVGSIHTTMKSLP